MEGDALVDGIRQLLINCEPHIRAAQTPEQAEEVLRHLEEYDENYHKYDLVKNLHKEIDECLGPLVDEEIEKHSKAEHRDQTGDQETMVATVTERVINSKQYSKLTRELKANVMKAVSRLLSNFDEELGTERRHVRSAQHMRSDKYSDDESSYSSNQWDMFMNQEQGLKYAEDLDNSNPLETRKEALKRLIQVPPHEAIQSDALWNALRKGLMDGLADPDPELSNLALKFSSRGLITTPQVIRDIYIMLNDWLASKFHARKNVIPKIKNGLDVKKEELKKMFRVFRLVNDFQRQVPNYWVRYSDRFLEGVVDSTLSLLSINFPTPVGESAQMTPVHFIALLDTKANWFLKWMHGGISRIPLLNAMKKYKNILENAVKQCLDFAAAKKIPIDLMSDVSEALSRESLGDGRRMHYTGHELEYAYFVHSLHLIGKILYHKDGRSFFPVRIRDRDDPVSMTSLLVTLINLINDPNYTTQGKNSQVTFEPGAMITEVLKKLCTSEEVCRICMCRDDITTALLAPVAQWLDGTLDHGSHQASELTYLHIADILQMIASTSYGRHHLLYGEGQNKLARNKSSAAHTIAEFAKKALSGNLPSEFGPPPTAQVIGAYVFMCRQLYNTCDGLLVLYPYDLHSAIAMAWREAVHEADQATPVPPPSPSTSGSDYAIKEHPFVVWEKTLLDNLLNYAGTPKGLLLLEQTGAINECVSHMYERYTMKLQVSKCEKFGYGFMVTQVASTAPGMHALQNAGFITALVHELWSVLECGIDDQPVFTPRPWPVDPIDRSAHKSLICLLNVLSAFPAVYEVLAGQPLPVRTYGVRDRPDMVVDLLDRIVFVDNDNKIHSLFNYEQSHVFGLRLLSVMMTCLDTFLLLQTQYKIQELLLSQQEANMSDDSTDIILDMLSLERNYALVKTYLIGGPSERIIPKRQIESGHTPFKLPLFSSYPVPREYTPNIAGRSAMKQANLLDNVVTSENELSRHLADTKSQRADVQWLEKSRRTFCNLLTTKPEQAKGNVMQDLLERVLPVISQIPEESIFPLIEYSGTDSALKGYHLTPLQQLGVKMAVRYGVHLKLLTSTPEATDNLSQLLKQCGYFLQQQQKSVQSSLRFLQGDYPGFDWFAATIFLLMNGNLDRSWKFMYHFSMLVASGYMWLPRLHSSVHLPQSLMNSGIPPLISTTGHYVELLVQAEVHEVYSAFKMSGYTVTQIIQHWLRQCFWNYLDWLDISHYIALCLLMGIDYQVYLCVAILKHLSQEILYHNQNGDLVIFLKEEPIVGFRVGEHLEFMQQLEKKFRKTILPDMQNITKP